MTSPAPLGTSRGAPSATAPAVQTALSWRFPARKEAVLDNGIRVLAYDCPGQFVVAVSLLFDVPLNAEPVGQDGVATLVGRSITQGAGGRGAEDFADALAVCGADLDASAFTDGFAVRLWVPATDLETGLRLMADTVTRPTLSTDDVTLQRHLRLQEIDHAHAYPEHVAGEHLNRVMFGPSRAGRPVGGTAESVTGLTPDNVREYADQHLQPAHATVSIAADFGDTDPIGLVAAALGSWQHVGGGPVARERQHIADTPRVVLVNWPEAPQATIRVAGPGINRSDPRWPGMFVANYAVGGSFSSRINTVLREEKGFTYGASSGLDTSRTSGVFTVSSAVRSDSTPEALADVGRILADASGSITDEEVTTAVRAATDSAALGFERADAVVGRVEMLLAQGLPLDHVDANLARIREVTREAANAAYEEVVRPEELTVVVAADADELTTPLEAWGHGPVNVVSPARR